MSFSPFPSPSPSSHSCPLFPILPPPYLLEVSCSTCLTHCYLTSPLTLTSLPGITSILPLLTSHYLPLPSYLPFLFSKLPLPLSLPFSVHHYHFPSKTFPSIPSHLLSLPFQLPITSLPPVLHFPLVPSSPSPLPPRRLPSSATLGTHVFGMAKISLRDAVVFGV